MSRQFLIRTAALCTIVAAAVGTEEAAAGPSCGLLYFYGGGCPTAPSIYDCGEVFPECESLPNTAYCIWDGYPPGGVGWMHVCDWIAPP